MTPAPPFCQSPDGRLLVGAPLPAAVLPGSFNPLHRGHRELAAAAGRRLGRTCRPRGCGRRARTACRFREPGTRCVPYFFGANFGSSSAHFASPFSRAASSGNE
jgi:hypothetical protein